MSFKRSFHESKEEKLPTVIVIGTEIHLMAVKINLTLQQGCLNPSEASHSYQRFKIVYPVEKKRPRFLENL